ncbi:WD40/YVTN/BNR-like repeat-containing protein [Halomarina litorea]|uniref:WD40/YVTN/BNR-like repeat-containing protein n=1 Tax=Halomarina litorea TaxID=2961595 RepID=UPI0020C33BA0|nr:hypothetical protein [Halomarina sp. BCD28]
MTRIYAALRDALVVLEGTDEEWTLRERFADHDLECVAASPDVPDRVFCGTFDAGLRRSTDGGETWDRVGGDVVGESVTAVTVSPHDPDEVWVGTEPSRVYHSTDAGETWAERPGLTDLPSSEEWYFPPRPETHHVRWISQSPHDPDRLAVSIEAGALVTSDDGGETWTDRVPTARRDNHTLATHPDAPGRLYAAAGDGYAETTDGGETWDHSQAGLDHRYCWSVAVDPGDPDTVVVSSASSAWTAHTPSEAESYVYRSEDGEWKRTMDGLPDPDGLLRAVLAPGGDGEFFALTNHGPYRSTDAGRSWRPLDVDWHDGYRGQAPRGMAVVP